MTARSSGQDTLPPWRRPYDNAATVDHICHCFRLLGRSPSPDEWVGHASQAGRALDRIVAGYLYSMEFDRRHLLRRSGDAPPLHQLPGFCIHAAPDDPANGELIDRGVYEPPVERQMPPGWPRWKRRCRGSPPPWPPRGPRRRSRPAGWPGCVPARCGG